jgi:hypothetical protein
MIEKVPGSSGRWKDLYNVPSHSRASVSYIVAIDDSGRWGCSCPQWKFHTPRRDCKHISEVKAELRFDRITVMTEITPAVKKVLSRFAFVEID